MRFCYNTDFSIMMFYGLEADEIVRKILERGFFFGICTMSVINLSY